jgi:23S rRNA pseudouridine2604 synthase
LRLAVKGSHLGLAEYLCALVPLQITGLRRIRLGRVGLGELALGQWRFLGEGERF